LALVDSAVEHGEQGKRVSGRLDQGRALVAELFGATPEGARARPLDAVETWGGTIRRMIIGGRTVILDNRLVAADVAEIRHEAETAARRLWARL